MNAHPPLVGQPAPPPKRAPLRESFYALFGGPVAWLVQLGAGHGLAGDPCVVGGLRALASAKANWTWPAMTSLIVAAALVALASLAVSWRAYRRTRRTAQGNEPLSLATVAGRTRFLALCGVALGGGFAVSTGLTAVGFLTLPRCAG